MTASEHKWVLASNQAYHRLVTALERNGCRRGSGSNWTCPAHDDQHASLSVMPADDRVLIHCHAGCSARDVVEAIKLTLADLFDEPRPAKEGEQRYAYLTQDGRRIGTMVRSGDKCFRWDGPKGGLQVPYHLPEIVTAVKHDRPVWIVEGEKDVETLREHGEVATCNAFGAGKWKPEFAEYFKGATVYIVADNDDAGFKHANAVYESVLEYAHEVRLFLAELDKKGADVTDHLEAGYSLDQLRPAHYPLGLDRLTYLDLNKWGDEIPPIDWLVEGWIAKSECAIVAGPPKAGKTQTIYHLALHLATGSDWMGYAVPEAVRVLHYDEEQSERLVYRGYRRTAKGMDVAPWDEGMLHVAVGQGVSIATEEGVERLEQEIKAFRPAVVILDSLTKVTAGIDDNEAHNLAKIYRNVNRLRSAYDCAFILIHHVRKGAFSGTKREHRLESIRGSGEHVGNADAVIWAERGPGDPQEFAVVVRRDSDTDDLPAILIRRVVNGDETGPVTLSCEGPAPKGNPGSIAQVDNAEGAILEALREKGTTLTTAEIKRATTPVGVPARTVERALANLTQAGAVEKLKRGQYRLVNEELIRHGGN